MCARLPQVPAAAWTPTRRHPSQFDPSLSSRSSRADACCEGGSPRLAHASAAQPLPLPPSLSTPCLHSAPVHGPRGHRALCVWVIFLSRGSAAADAPPQPGPRASPPAAFSLIRSQQVPVFMGFLSHLFQGCAHRTARPIFLAASWAVSATVATAVMADGGGRAPVSEGSAGPDTCRKCRVLEQSRNQMCCQCRSRDQGPARQLSVSPRGPPQASTVARCNELPRSREETASFASNFVTFCSLLRR